MAEPKLRIETPSSKYGEIEVGTPQFEYKPLQQREFRLIKFHPGDWSHCELEHYKHDESPPYCALSYAWGSVKYTHHIRVGGGTLQVTDNLWAALPEIRKYVQENNLYLWIDAVCINQDDLGERSAQVVMMKQIYTQAELVAIWLGEHGDDSENATAKMPALADYFTSQVALGSDGELVEDWNFVSPRNPFIWDEEGTQCYKDWQAISALHQRSWFNRAWVVQEYVASRERLYFCGDSRFQDADVSITCAIAWILHFSPEVTFNFSNITSYMSLEGFRTRRRVHRPLLDICGMLRKYESSDPRDKIYAVIGIASDLQPGDLMPDYSKPFEDVYLNFAESFLTSSILDYRLEFLGHVIRTSHKPIFPLEIFNDLPSWVPDWRTKVYVKPFLKRLVDIEEDSFVGKVYNASRETVFDGKVAGRELHISGFTIDVISKVESVSLSTADEIRNDEVVKYWMPSNRNETYLPTSETMEAAFNRTITADCLEDVRRVDPKRPHLFDWKSAAVMHEDQENSAKFNDQSHSCESMRDTTFGRRLIYTGSGLLGLGPAAAEVGDKICVFLGGQVLYIVRETAEFGHEFIGECYIHGLMDGEALENETYKERLEVFILV